MTLPFDRPEALALNEARMNHVKKLGLIQPGMRVLDVGAGVGRLSEYLLNWGCEVVALEGREENVKEAKRRYPGLDIRVCDIESEVLPIDGDFDAVLMFGVLYHLKDPVTAMGHIYEARAPLLLVSTVVTDSDLSAPYPVHEVNSADQALNGGGCRPSPGYVKWLLYLWHYQTFDHILQPHHFAYQWTPLYDGQCQRNGTLLRQFFVGEAK